MRSLKLSPVLNCLNPDEPTRPIIGYPMPNDAYINDDYDKLQLSNISQTQEEIDEDIRKQTTLMDNLSNEMNEL